jgi:phage/plasmid-associated DNA primase
LTALGGRPVLVPIWLGMKKPLFDDWQKLTFEQTQNRDLPLVWSKPIEGSKERETYRRGTYGSELDRVRREGGNLGVILGRPSAMEVPLTGARYVLASIDVDRDDVVDAFLALNPRLGRTLRTRGRRGCNFWLWVEADAYVAGVKHIFDALPDGTPSKVKWGEWRTDGGQTVVYGVHPDTGGRYQRISESPTPVNLAFADIVWPAGLSLPWMPTPAEQLVARVGPGWMISEKGAISINQPYFAAKYSMEHHVLFEPDEAAFYLYEAARGLWIKTSDDTIQTAIEDDIKTISDAEKIPQLITMRSSSFLRGCVQILRGRVEKRDAFRREAGLIHLRNCMLDLRGGELKIHPFGPKHYSRNQVPVDFDAAATCAQFISALVGQSVLSAERADLLQRWAGSLLLGPNVLQRFVLLYGTSGGGKSTFVGLMRKMIGEANCTQLRTKHLEERFEMFFYVGKSLLIAPDVNGDFLQQDGAHVLKALVGGDPLSAERKQGGAAIQITGDFHIAITCNSRLLIKLEGDADAFRRRMLPIHYCLPKPAKRIDDFQSILFSSEASGILNWMLAGARRVLEQKQSHGDYILSAVQQEEIDSLLAESDSVRHFISHAVERSEAGDTLTIHELCEAYVLYCDDKGWRAETFKRAMNAMPDAVSEFWHMTPRNDIKRGAAEDGKPKQQRGYKGLRLIKAEPELVVSAATGGTGEDRY